MNRKYTKEGLRESVKQSGSYQELFELLNLTSKSSYKNIQNRIKEFGLDVSHFKTRNKHTKDNLTDLAHKCVSFSEMLRRLNLRPGGGTQAYISRKLKMYGIDTSHFLGSGNRLPQNKKSWQEILTKGSNRCRTAGGTLRKALIASGRDPKCESSGCMVTNSWIGKPIKLQVHHEDGDWLNNLPENLKLYCPNCHSQTPNYCSGNRKTK